MGVNYILQLVRSREFAEVRTLYTQAGLSLLGDLLTLQHASRVTADPAAVNYLVKNIVFNGQLRLPVLTMHTTGDGLVQVQQEQAYASVVRAAGNESLLRQIFVHRAGHCAFTPAETITAFQTLVRRLDTGSWDNTDDAQALNDAASGLGSGYNIVFSGGRAVPAAPAFVRYQPNLFLRPFDDRSLPVPAQ